MRWTLPETLRERCGTGFAWTGARLLLVAAATGNCWGTMNPMHELQGPGGCDPSSPPFRRVFRRLVLRAAVTAAARRVHPPAGGSGPTRHRLLGDAGLVFDDDGDVLRREHLAVGERQLSQPIPRARSSATEAAEIHDPVFAYQPDRLRALIALDRAAHGRACGRRRPRRCRVAAQQPRRRGVQRIAEQLLAQVGRAPRGSIARSSFAAARTSGSALAARASAVHRPASSGIEAEAHAARRSARGALTSPFASRLATWSTTSPPTPGRGRCCPACRTRSAAAT